MYIYYIYISIYIGIYYVRVVRNAVVVVERGLVRQQQRKNGSYFTHVYIYIYIYWFRVHPMCCRCQRQNTTDL